jgi:predicted DNA-binding transcriptional regulator AlpA
MKVLTLLEAAKYLRVSRSWLYQRKDVPRHQIPGSRSIRFFEEELALWLQGNDAHEAASPGTPKAHANSLATSQPSGYYRKSRPTR